MVCYLIDNIPLTWRHAFSALLQGWVRYFKSTGSIMDAFFFQENIPILLSFPFFFSPFLFYLFLSFIIQERALLIKKKNLFPLCFSKGLSRKSGKQPESKKRNKTWMFKYVCNFDFVHYYLPVLCVCRYVRYSNKDISDMRASGITWLNKKTKCTHKAVCVKIRLPVFLHSQYVDFTGKDFTWLQQ